MRARAPAPERFEWYRWPKEAPGAGDARDPSRRQRWSEVPLERFLGWPGVAWLSRHLLEPDVRGKIMVVHSRRRFLHPGLPGLFAEFHSVLGALHYAEQNGAAGVRVNFEAANYVDPEHGPNWWNYFFTPERMLFGPDGSFEEVHLTRRVARFGRYWGFAGIVNGPTPHLYPKTYGLSRAELHRSIDRCFRVQPRVQEKVDRYVADHFQGAPLVVGVHYRGTDTAEHYPYYRVPYAEYFAELDRVIAASGAGAGAGALVYVATDEQEFLAEARSRYGGRVCCWEASPRLASHDEPIHSLSHRSISNYAKGETALIDCLLLASTDYLVKGRSNVSDAALAFNPSLAYSFLLG